MPSEYEIKRAYEKGAQGGQRVPKSTFFGLVKTSRQELAANRRGLNDGYRSEERERRQRERDEERQRQRDEENDRKERSRESRREARSNAADYSAAIAERELNASAERASATIAELTREREELRGQLRTATAKLEEVQTKVRLLEQTADAALTYAEEAFQLLGTKKTN